MFDRYSEAHDSWSIRSLGDPGRTKDANYPEAAAQASAAGLSGVESCLKNRVSSLKNLTFKPSRYVIIPPLLAPFAMKSEINWSWIKPIIE
jgi:hypothetical protein